MTDGPVRAVTRPILPSADLTVTAGFYARFGFVELGRWPQEYLILTDPHDIELHFWFNPDVTRWTNDVACWIGFDDPADALRLYAEWSSVAIAEPAVLNAPSQDGHLVEFQLIDVHGNLLRVGAPSAAR